LRASEQKAESTLHSLDSILQDIRVGNIDELNRLVMELFNQYEASLKRKDEEISVVKQCLKAEEDKLYNERQRLEQKAKLLKEKRIEQQHKLAELEGSN